MGGADGGGILLGLPWLDMVETKDSRLDGAKLVVLVEYRAEEGDVPVEDQSLRRWAGLGRMTRGLMMALEMDEEGLELGMEAPCGDGTDGAGLNVSVGVRRAWGFGEFSVACVRALSNAVATNSWKRFSRFPFRT